MTPKKIDKKRTEKLDKLLTESNSKSMKKTKQIMEMIEYHKSIRESAIKDMELAEKWGQENSLLYKSARHHKKVAEACLEKEYAKLGKIANKEKAKQFKDLYKEATK